MKVDSRAVSAYQTTAKIGGAKTERTKGADQAGGAKPARAPAASGKDANVTFSAEARQLAAGQPSDVDQAKVAALKEKIASGNLELDSHAIARGIVDRTG